jgi:hypothetical protein
LQPGEGTGFTWFLENIGAVQDENRWAGFEVTDSGISQKSLEIYL